MSLTKNALSQGKADSLDEIIIEKKLRPQRLNQIYWTIKIKN